MRPAASNSSSNEIKVIVSRMGSNPIEVSLPNDDSATVESALTRAGVAYSSTSELFVGGQRAALNNILENGDILAVTTPKQAGI